MKREGIDEALAKCNIFRQVKTIQISSSIKFVSIEFDTPTTVETFCFEPLALKDNFSRYFHTRLSETKQKTHKIYLHQPPLCSICSNNYLQTYRPICSCRRTARLSGKEIRQNRIPNRYKNLQSFKYYKRHPLLCICFMKTFVT